MKNTLPMLVTRLVGLVVLAVSAAGCAQPTATPAPASAPPVTQLPAATPTPAPQPTLPASQESVITIVIPEDPPSFDPLISDTGYDALVKNLAVLGLTDIDPDGKIYPVLAAELPTLENGGVVLLEDGSKMDVTWKLRPDVNWADGQPVTAADVLFTYAAISNPDTGAWTEGLDYVDGIDQVDTHTFVVHFNAVYPGYLTLFGGVKGTLWPAHYCQADQGYAAWDCARTPLSNGPYLLKEWVSGDHLTFTRNPGYYQAGKPQIEKIIVRIVPDIAVRAQMLKKGDADVIMWATEQILADFGNDPNVKVSHSPQSRWVMRLFPNLAAKGATDPVQNPNPYLADVRVRQAIRLAIDVDTISTSVWHGLAKPVWTEFYRAPYACAIPRPAYDPAAAKALLEQAGWVDTNSDGVRECAGCQYGQAGAPLQLDLNIYSEYGEPLELSQQLIGEMLSQVGFRMELSAIQGSVMWADSASGGTEQRGDFNLDMYDDGYKGVDPAYFLRQYYASASAEVDNGWNVGRWQKAEFDALLEQTNTLDEPQRQAAFCQMAQILEAELPQILLFTAINADAYATRLDGLNSNINDVITWNVADWTLVK